MNAFDAVIVAFLAALKAGTADSTVWKDDLADVSGPGGTQYAYRDLAQAIKDVIAGVDIDYEGASGPINFDENGDPSGLYDEWTFENGKIKVLEAEVPHVRDVGHASPSADGVANRPRPPRYRSTTFSSWSSSSPRPSYRFCPMSRT